MNDNEKYLEAARLIAGCKPSKLQHVLAVLRQGGFDVGDEEIEFARRNAMGRKDWLISARSQNESRSWENTDDPDILLLREAFKNGASLSTVANVAGINTASVYRFLYAKKKPTPYMRDRILYGLKEAYGIEPKE